jgi:1,4-alpha-glucan branching enzyme
VIQHDGLRLSLRHAIAQASNGGGASLNLAAVTSNINPYGVEAAWKAVTCIENHRQGRHRPQD